jgi:site-specific recombinase XerD
LTDANLLAEGLHVKRRKGSKDNIAQWSSALVDAVNAAKELRAGLIKRRKLPVRVKPDKRYLFLSQTGGRLSEDTAE